MLVMMSENEAIKNKLVERSADLEVARNRWVFAFIATALFFFIILGIYISPASELSTQNERTYSISKNSYDQSGRIDAVAIPTLYQIYFDFELDEQLSGEHARVYIYIFKDALPDLSLDTTGNDLHEYLKSRAVRNSSLTNGRTELNWELAFRDSDTNTFYVMFYNPDNIDDPYDNLDVIFSMNVYYEPMLPLVPIFFVLAFLIILPLAIIRTYIINQKKKELRVLLSLDLANLSDEDKVRLGIPITPKQHKAAAPAGPPKVVPTYSQSSTYSPPPPSAVPMTPGSKPPVRSQPKRGGPKDGYMTVDDI
jgi:hypothetical protein